MFDVSSTTVQVRRCLATVVNQTSKPKSKWRPLLLDTFELEKLARRKLMPRRRYKLTRIAIRIHQLSSYANANFSSSLNFTNFTHEQIFDENWGQFVTNLLVTNCPPFASRPIMRIFPSVQPNALMACKEM